MNAEQFFRLVESMRKAQKKLFPNAQHQVPQ